MVSRREVRLVLKGKKGACHLLQKIRVEHQYGSDLEFKLGFIFKDNEHDSTKFASILGGER